jgi:hypothetical protein
MHVIIWPHKKACCELWMEQFHRGTECCNINLSKQSVNVIM